MLLYIYVVLTDDVFQKNVEIQSSVVSPVHCLYFCITYLVLKIVVSPCIVRKIIKKKHRTMQGTCYSVSDLKM